MDSIETTTNIPAGSETNQSRSLRFEFRGDGMEYFKIWIVNVLLTIITLGIYSAWATVRNNRYFYSNMYLDGTNFQYLAEPLAILKGRLIAIAALVIYMVVSSILPVVGVVLMVLLIVGMPYFINQSMRFKMRMSAYKNIQFRFHGTYLETVMVFFVWPLLGVLTLGILFPMAFLKIDEYMSCNTAYGTTRFEFKATYGQYGMIFLTVIGVGLVFAFVGFLIAKFIPAIAIVIPVATAALYLGVIVYFMVSTINLFYNSLSVKNNTFSGSLTMQGLVIVIVINALLTVLTLGLYLPAAKVRMTKYLAENITFEANDSLDNFAAAEKQDISALGEEFGQVFDFGM